MIEQASAIDNSSLPPIGNETLPRTEKIKFHGKGGEYFGIWFVNNILTWMTLGIYSPWAKVRNFQYFYGNSELANNAFSFNASPISILKSRIIAVLLFLAFFLSDITSSDAATYVYFGFIIAYFAFAPILMVLVASFQLRYSSWRGIDFKFNKDYKGAYKVYIPPLAALLLVIGSFFIPANSEEIEDFFGLDRYEWNTEATQHSEHKEHTEDSITAQMSEEELEAYCAEFLESELEEMPPECDESSYVNPYFFIPVVVAFFILLLGIPYFDFINHRFIATNTHFGLARVGFVATAKDYYRVYWIWLLASMLLVSLWALAIAYTETIGKVLIVASIVYIPFTKAYLISRRYNLLFGKSKIAGDNFRLRANIPFAKLAFVLITNTLAVTFSLGLATAWAKVRSARVILESMQLEVHASLDQFVASQEAESSALAEEVADVFDLDLSL